MTLILMTLILITLTLMTLILMTLTLKTLISKYCYPNISGICESDKSDIIFTKSSSMG